MAKKKRRVDNRYLAIMWRQMIRKFDDPVLHQKSEPVIPGDNLSFLSKMKRACTASETGVGLAAVQIGILKNVVYIAPPEQKSYFMVNSSIVSASEEMQTAQEGCLSYPGVWTDVERHKSITVVYYDDKDLNLVNPITKTFAGFESRIIQHELDHVAGVCRVGDVWAATKSGAKLTSA